MTDRKAMLDLAAKVEAASGPDRELERQIATALGWTEVQSYQGGNIGKPPLRSIYPKQRVPKFSASVDAALSLVPEGAGFKVDRYWIANVDGPVWMAAISTGGVPENPRRVFDAWDCASAALATCAAALKARAHA